jgi:hypothetical protein
LAIWWDGVVSNLRAYGVAELEELTRDLDGPGYTFEAGEVPAGPTTITWLTGRPRAPEAGDRLLHSTGPGSGESA